MWKAFPMLALSLAAVAAMASLTGCTLGSGSMSWGPEAESVQHDASGKLRADSGIVAFASGETQGAAEPAPSPAERMLVQRAELRLAVSSPEETGRKAASLAKELGGYAQSVSNEAVVLRVPAAAFEQCMDRLAKLGRVLARAVSVQDVTEEVVDLKLRLKNALALRDRLAALLEKAEKVEDVLKIEAELTRVRVEVERLEGRLKLMEHDIALSTISLQLVQARAAQRSERLPFQWLQELGLGSLLGGL